MSIAAVLVDCWRHIAGSLTELERQEGEEAAVGSEGHTAVADSGWRTFGRRHWHSMRRSQPWWGMVREVVVSSHVGQLDDVHVVDWGTRSSLRGEGRMWNWPGGLTDL